MEESLEGGRRPRSLMLHNSARKPYDYSCGGLVPLLVVGAAVRTETLYPLRGRELESHHGLSLADASKADLMKCRQLNSWF